MQSELESRNLLYQFHKCILHIRLIATRGLINMDSGPPMAFATLCLEVEFRRQLEPEKSIGEAGLPFNI